MNGRTKAEILAALQADILKLQGFRNVPSGDVDSGLGPVNAAFPNQTFPVGSVHEFIAGGLEGMAATCGFISALLKSLTGEFGTLMWIGTSRKVYPPSLTTFGLKPERVLFIDLKKPQQVLWAMEEALKCKAVSAVIGEIQELSFTNSRRLQLAVEESRVTGFVLRQNPKSLNTTACVSRWRITSCASEPIDDLPGLGYPAWRVELLRIRNGKTGLWEMKWTPSGFEVITNAREVSDLAIQSHTQNRKAG